MPTALTFPRSLGRLLLMFVRGIFFVTGKIPFLLLMIGVGIYGFLINDQGRDLMIAFSTDEASQGVLLYLSLFILYLFLWSTILWYVARIVLHSANLKNIVDRQIDPRPFSIQGAPLPDNMVTAQIDLPYKRTMETLARWVPRLLALAPYLIFLIGFSNVAKLEKGNLAVAIIVTVIALLHIFYLWGRQYLVRYTLSKISKKDQPDIMENRFQLDAEKDLKKIIRVQRLKVISILLLLAVVACFTYSWYSARQEIPGLHGKPGLIILAALIVYSFLGLFVNYLSNLLRFPLMTVLVILALFISLPRNNNHGLQIIRTNRGLQQAENRLPDSTYAQAWLRYRLADSSRYFSHNHVIPVFIIAAEGGGIRACYWTTELLKQLHMDFDTRFPGQRGGFYKNTFAVTGASGGSVGLGFFYNYLYGHFSRQKDFNFSDSLNYAPLDSLAGSDFLSGVSFGFAFPDFLQRFLPWKIPAWDRARFLGSSFSRCFRAHAGQPDGGSLLDSGYLCMWQNAYQPERFPALLFNSLYVEQGQKALFSPFRLSNRFYPDVLDIIDSIGTSPRMSEGMVSSARFPLITPPGLMEKYRPGLNDDGQPFGHLVDGGYFENTAVQTAQETVRLLRQAALSLGKDLADKQLIIRPIIISVVFGTATHGPQKPMGASYEMAPVTGASKTLFRWIDGARELLIEADSSGELRPFYFRLYNPPAASLPHTRSSRFKLPLGWYLSSFSRNIIRGQLKGGPYRQVRDNLFQLLEHPMEVTEKK